MGIPTEVFTGIGVMAMAAAWFKEKFWPTKTNRVLSTADHDKICEKLQEDLKIRRIEDRASNNRSVEQLSTKIDDNHRDMNRRFEVVFHKIDDSRKETNERLDKLWLNLMNRS